MYAADLMITILLSKWESQLSMSEFVLNSFLNYFYSHTKSHNFLHIWGFYKLDEIGNISIRAFTTWKQNKKKSAT